MKTIVSTFKQKKREGERENGKDRKWIFRIFDPLEIVGSLDSFESFVSRILVIGSSFKDF